MIRHSKDGYCISLPFVVKCSCKPPEKTTTLLPPVITTDNNLITAHRIGWIIWTHQIIKKMRYQIYEAKSVKHDAQQREGIEGLRRSRHEDFLSSNVFWRCAPVRPAPGCMNCLQFPNQSDIIRTYSISSLPEANTVSVFQSSQRSCPAFGNFFAFIGFLS